MIIRVRSSAFTTPSLSPGSTHHASRWQLDHLNGDFSAPIADTGWSTTELYQHDTADLPVARYLIRVAYQDSFLMESDWSDPIEIESYEQGVVPTPVPTPPTQLNEIKLGPLNSIGDLRTASTELEGKINELIKYVRALP